MRAGDVRRTIAFVVDDLFLSAESVVSIKRSMRAFVDEQMQPGDLVAVVRTGGDSGGLQEFTSDKRELHAAVDAIHWNPRGAKTGSAFSPPDESLLETRPAFQNDERSTGPRGRRFSKYRNEQNKRNLLQAELQRSQSLAVAMLTTLGETVQSLDELPGRKSVVLFSEGFRVLSGEFLRNYQSGEGEQKLSLDAYGNATSSRGDRGMLGYLRFVVDRANRAAVSIYAVDPRGVVDPTFATAQHSTVYLDRERRDAHMGEVRDEYLASATALHYLADKTGGEVTSSNDPGYGIGRAVEGLGSYYSIGYLPEGTFGEKERPAFHEIVVRVKRPGLKVRARSGFYGVTDAELRRSGSASDRMARALTSPFVETELDVRLASQFDARDRGESTLRAVLHVDAEDLTFAKAADGSLESTVSVYALLVGETGAAVAKAERTSTLRIRGEELERARREGVVFVVNVPVSQPGAYRLRAAVREASSERIGSASQFVRVPDVEGGPLALSGILLRGETTAPTGVSGAGLLSRRLAPGSDLRYAFVVYGAAAGKEAPKLDMQIAIWRDGKRVFEGPAEPLALRPQKDWKRIDVMGSFRLSARIPPGQYLLQVTVADRLAESGPPPATEWIDFEVAR